MIDLCESMGPGRDRTNDPCICHQTRYRMCYVARFDLSMHVNLFHTLDTCMSTVIEYSN